MVISAQHSDFNGHHGVGWGREGWERGDGDLGLSLIISTMCRGDTQQTQSKSENNKNKMKLEDLLGIFHPGVFKLPQPVSKGSRQVIPLPLRAEV